MSRHNHFCVPTLSGALSSLAQLRAKDTRLTRVSALLLCFHPLQYPQLFTTCKEGYIKTVGRRHVAVTVICADIGLGSVYANAKLSDDIIEMVTFLKEVGLIIKMFVPSSH